MNKKKILLVEDDRDLLELMNKNLVDNGFDTVCAETGQQALDFLQSRDLDLVLLDIILPDIDGLTVLSEITKNPKLKNLPVIILSNLDDVGSFEQAAAIGQYEYLVKAKTELKTVVAKIKEKLKLD
jgi:CheY-like chemotaxis protein